MSMSEDEKRELNKQVRATAALALEQTESTCAMFPTEYPDGEKLIAVFASGPFAMKIFELMMKQISNSGPHPTQKVAQA